MSRRVIQSFAVCVRGISYLVSGKAQEEGFRKVEQLKNELIVLQQAKRNERKRQIQLEQEHTALTEELAKEKVI